MDTKQTEVFLRQPLVSPDAPRQFNFTQAHKIQFPSHFRSLARAYILTAVHDEQTPYKSIAAVKAEQSCSEKSIVLLIPAVCCLILNVFKAHSRDSLLVRAPVS